MEQHERLKEIRKELRLNQNEMAEKLGIKQSYYSAMERGAKPISRATTGILFHTLKVSPDWFLKGNGTIFSDAGDSAKGAIAANDMGKILDLAIQGHWARRPTRYAQTLTAKEVDFELSHAIDQLKDVYNDRKLLGEFLRKIDAPEFLLEKFPVWPDFKIHKQKIEKEFEEEHNHLSAEELKLLKINMLYHDDFDAVRNSVSKLIKYLHTYAGLIKQQARKNKASTK